MRLLYLTRKFPPMVGGMENLSFALAKEFKKNVDLTLIKWGGSQKFLPIVLPLFLIRSLYLIPIKKVDHILIGDGLLSPLGILLKKIFRIKTYCTVVGLDVTFNFPGYQLLVPWCLRRLDKIICISDATKDECLKRGIAEDKCIVIPCGVYPNNFITKASKQDLERFVNSNLTNKKILITVGRLVKRKGVYWFVKNVLPKLNKNTVYLIIGDGSEKDKIRELIYSLDLQDRVFLMGKVTDEKLKVIYNTADLFIMPNIKISGTIEGFGIVAIEASSAGVPVIASDIEGIRAAVIDGKTGILVRSKDTKAFVQAIETPSKFHKKEISRIINKKFSWKKIGNDYVKSMRLING